MVSTGAAVAGIDAEISGGCGVSGVVSVAAAVAGKRPPQMVQKAEDGSAVAPHDWQVLMEETGAGAGAAFGAGWPHTVQKFIASLI
jgi:hypothetical protein